MSRYLLAMLGFWMLLSLLVTGCGHPSEPSTPAPSASANPMATSSARQQRRSAFTQGIRAAARMRGQRQSAQQTH